MQDQTPEKPPAASLTVSYDGNSFSSRLEGEGMPIIPLLGVLVLQIVQLAARQIDENQKQAAMQQQIHQARRAAQGGKLFMPDGSPYQG